MSDVFSSLPDLFVGLWVDVDPELRTGSRNSEGDRARITDIDDNNNISVKYVIGDVTSPNVQPSRIRHPNFVLNGRRNARLSNSSSAPSLLSHLYGEYRSQIIMNQTPHDQPPQRRIVDLIDTEQVNTSKLLCLLMDGKNLSCVVKLIKKKNLEEGKGWLRKIETKNIVDKKNTHLSSKGKDQLLKLLIALKPKYRNTTSILATAWDVVSSTVRRMLVAAKTLDNFSIARK